MTRREPDRRVRRTKRRLKEALLQLIEERDYERITIEDLTGRADVGRSTFYSHFSSKEDLLFSGFDTWLGSLAESVPDVGKKAGGDGDFPRFRFSLPLLKHIRSQKRFFLATFHQSADPRIRQRIFELIVEPVKLELARLSARGGALDERPVIAGVDLETTLQAQAHAAVGAFLALVSWWLSASDEQSPEAVDELFQNLLVPR